MGRCDVPARVQRAERTLTQRANHIQPCAAERGADGAARQILCLKLQAHSYETGCCWGVDDLLFCRPVRASSSIG
jgi:hypothetical protein